MSKAEKIVIGMSGGVDSSAAAYLLKEQGYEVIGVTMQTESVSPETLEDAARVAQKIGIAHYVIDFQSEFRRFVIEDFVRSYLAGRTPNPCIACNRLVKWEALMQRAQELGAQLVATGHYTRPVQLKNGRYTLQRTEGGKDQTYVLYRLTQEELSRTRMPLADYRKEEVRELAARIGLTVADKPDSQEICFIPEGNYVEFLEQYTGVKMQPGFFVDVSGNRLGMHKGLWHYTVGQRKGLGIALGKPMFVTEIRPETNEVVLGENEAVFADGLVAEEMNYMAVEGILPGETLRLEAQIRYSHRPAPGVLEAKADGTVCFWFDTPQRAVTPGQGAVFYRDGHIWAGGTVHSACRRKG